MLVSNVTSKGQVTVPVSLRRELGIKAGGKVRFLRKGQQLILEAANDPPLSSLFGILKAPKGRGIKDLDVAIEQAWNVRAREISKKGRA